MDLLWACMVQASQLLVSGLFYLASKGNLGLKDSMSTVVLGSPPIYGRTSNNPVLFCLRVFRLPMINSVLKLSWSWGLGRGMKSQSWVSLSSSDNHDTEKGLYFCVCRVWMIKSKQ